MKKRTFLLIAVLLAAMGAARALQADEKPIRPTRHARDRQAPADAKAMEDRQGKPNVVLFFMDDLNFSGMGAGYDLMPVSFSERLTGGEPESPVIVTPRTDTLVEQSLVFDQFYITSPVCTPSQFNLKKDFAPGQHTLPGMFKSAGYRTGIVGKLHCEDGYEKMRVIYFENTDARFLPNQLIGYNLNWCTDGALDFLEANKAEPFLLYFSLNVPAWYFWTEACPVQLINLQKTLSNV